MAQCPKCGLAAEPALKFCTGCGSSIVEQAPPSASLCSKCGKENPAGSKFCASCGSSMVQAGVEPPQATTPPCVGCGTTSPEGSKFCIRCGKPIGIGAQSFSPPPNPVGPGTTFIPRGTPQPLSMELQRVRMILFLGVAVNLVGIFQLYRLMSGLEQLWGVYANTSGLAFLIFINFAIAASLAFSAMQLSRGDLKYGKIGVVIMVVASALALVLGGTADLFTFLLNLACLAGGIWAWMMVSRAERTASPK